MILFVVSHETFTVAQEVLLKKENGVRCHSEDTVAAGEGLILNDRI